MASGLVHAESCPATKSEVDLWVVPPTQMAIAKKYPVEYRPVASLTGEAPLIEFLIPASADTYYDLDMTFLKVQMKVKVYKTVNNAKTEVAMDADGRKTFSPVNNMLHSLIQRCDLELNGKLVTTSSQHYSYRSYLEVLLNYDTHAMDTYLKSCGWLKDTDFKVSENRAKLVDDDGVVDLFGRLRLDLFNQARLLLGGLEMKLAIQAHRPTFYFITKDAEHTVEVQWTHAALFLVACKLESPIMTAHEKALAASTAKYPVTRVDVKQFVIPAGSGNVPIDTVFAGQLPRRIFMVMVDNAAENGSFITNPFKFEHFDVNYLLCLVNGEAYPAIPLTPDFAKKQVKREYHTLFDSIEQNPTRPILSLTPEEFLNGYTIFAWNLAPDFADGCSSHWNVVKRGSCRLELRFKTPLAKVTTILFVAEFDNVIEIDQDRNVITDY